MLNTKEIGKSAYFPVIIILHLVLLFSRVKNWILSAFGQKGLLTINVEYLIWNESIFRYLIFAQYFKSAVMLFFKLNQITPLSGLSNDILCILVTQGAAKLLEVNLKVRK